MEELDIRVEVLAKARSWSEDDRQNRRCEVRPESLLRAPQGSIDARAGCTTAADSESHSFHFARACTSCSITNLRKNGHLVNDMRLSPRKNTSYAIERCHLCRCSACVSQPRSARKGVGWVVGIWWESEYRETSLQRRHVKHRKRRGTSAEWIQVQRRTRYDPARRVAPY